MSTSLLYHAFGIRGYRYVRTDFFEGEVVFTIEQGRHTLQCPLCGSREVIAHGEVPRSVSQRCPSAPRARACLLKIPRVECRACQVTRQVAVPFADPQKQLHPRLRTLCPGAVQRI